MRITKLTLQTAKLEDQRIFYERVLGLPLMEATTDTFTVQAGETQLTFQATEAASIFYHFAFTIPGKKLGIAKDWVQTHIGAPMTDENGEDEFPSESWNANSFYFHDAANNILEFIIHHDLANDQSGAFDAHDILRISEIGLPVDNVPATVAQLEDRLGLEPYKGQSDTFTALGDIYGLFIVVKIGRPWWPTTTERAVVAPVHATILGTEKQTYQVPSFPYIIDVVVP